MTDKIFIQTGHWPSRELPADAPVRYEGKLTTLSEIPGWANFEVFENDRWQEAMKVDPPKKMRFTVEVEVESVLDPPSVLRTVREGLRDKEFRAVTVTPIAES